MATIDTLEISTFTIPTDAPESDGTFVWDQTTMVLVEISAGGHRGIGYTYGDASIARVIHSALGAIVRGHDPMAIPAAWCAMNAALRNIGDPGIGSMAVSAVDTAMWDLKSRLLGVPLVTLLGAARDSIPVYGSGGFTAYTIERLREQLGGWAENGFTMVKMKVGREADRDVERVREARDAIGPDCALFVDANGAYSRKQALAQAEAFARAGVSWFEEPVSSDDLDGLRLLRDRAPAGMDITAGEYGYTSWYFRHMLDAGAVDVLQADATRCGGFTGLMHVDALCVARSLPLSAHCAPALHMHACCALPAMRHLEYFHDHARIESMLFDGAVSPCDGALHPDTGRMGLGLTLKRADAQRFAA